MKVQERKMRETDTLDTAAIGYMLVMIFYKSKSIIPCIIFHSIFNSLSIFNNGYSTMLRSIILIVICLTYVIYINKYIKKNKL